METLRRKKTICAIKAFMVILLCVLLCAPMTQAQQVQDKQPQANKAISQDVMIIIQQEKVRFTAQKSVDEMRLEIFDQTGELIYDSGAITEAELNWPLQNADGETVKSGLYAYRLSIKEEGAETARVRRGHFIVDRAKERDGKTDRLWITSQSEDGVGTELTVARNDETTVAGTSTASERASGKDSEKAQREGEGDDKTKSDKKEGKGKDKAKSDKKEGQETLAVDAGTPGQLAKFISAEEIGDSGITETGEGKVGIGTTNPTEKLTVQTASGNYGFTHTDGNIKLSTWVGTGVLGARGGWLGTQSPDALHFFTSNGNPSMTITAAGNVGIWTTVPSYTLDVAGTLRAALDTSNDITVQTTGGTNAWAQFRMQTPSQQWSVGTSHNWNGNPFYIADNTNNQIRMTVQPNGGEINFPSPSSNHVVVQTTGGTNAWAQFRMQTQNQRWSIGTSQNFNGDQLYFYDDLRGQIRMAIQTNGNVGIGTTDPQARLDVAGQTRTQSLQITGGADFSENFDVNVAATTSSEAMTAKVEAGMVVSIDPANPGRLALSAQAYDRRVAGIISGAGGVKPGMIMSQEGSVADGQHPVALSGRVYCWADASNRPITPGDLLTTSATPGHAMKVTNYAEAQGAILGKAMTGLAQGRGLVLVLVTLQ